MNFDPSRARSAGEYRKETKNKQGLNEVSFSKLCLSASSFLLLLSAELAMAKKVESKAQMKPFHYIAHRGASGRYPEHTLLAYGEALKLYSKWLELDLVVSKDKSLWIRHEPNLSETTNANELFPEKITTKTIAGKSMTGVFVEDLTDEQLKSVKAIQRLPSRDHRYDRKESIVKFSDFLKWAQEKSKEFTFGIVPELKHPSFYLAREIQIQDLVIKEIRQFQNDINASGPKIVSTAGSSNLNFSIIFQCNEFQPLIDLKKAFPNSKTLFLLEAPREIILGGYTALDPQNDAKNDTQPTYESLFKEANLKLFKSSGIDFIGPPREWIAIPSYHKTLNKQKIDWIPYTLKIENFEGSKRDQAGYEKLYREVNLFQDLGASGVFSDDPELSIRFNP